MGTLIKSFVLTLAIGLSCSGFTNQLLTLNNDYDRDDCSSECTEGIANTDVVFMENRMYTYDFEGNTNIITPTDTPEGKTDVSIKGNVIIIGTNKCGAILNLRNVIITQGSKTYSNKDLEEHPILFSYNNGKIGQNICSSEKDSVASLNLKRALASALQVSSVQYNTNDIFEMDNQGICNTTYSATSSDKSRMIFKDKDLTKCSGYERINLLGMSSSDSNQIKGDSPFTVATQHSEIQIIKSTIKFVSNLETFYYQPFGSLDIEMKMVASMNLNLKKISGINQFSINLKKMRSIFFDKSNSMVQSVNAEDLIKAHQLAMQNLEPVVEMNAANYFADLTSLLKVAKKNDILSAYEFIKSGVELEDTEAAMTVFIDALIAANSGESIEVVLQLIKSNELSDSVVISYFANLVNSKLPTKESLVSASNLLNDRPLKECYHGMSFLVQKYLQNTQDYDSTEVKIALENLGKPLKKAYDTSLSSDDENLVIASLKALGNVKHINHDLENLIAQIIGDKSVSQRIRAAALNMIKVYAKSSQLEEACKNIFIDASEDSEMRILAFKVYASNPSNDKARIIKNVLDDKNCQLQIRAFLLSYINTLQNTEDENKLDQKKFYEGIKPVSSKRMLSDILRYSQTVEYFHQCPLLHSGVMLNGDIIYSYKSFLARSSSVSLKALIFGRNYDVLKFDFRVENIESILETLFGPEGFLSQTNDRIYGDIKKYVTQAISYAKSRRLKNENSELSSETDFEHLSDDDSTKILIDIALEAFGNDMGWFSIQGNKSQITLKYLIDAILNKFESSVPDKKDLQLNVKKQTLIIDYEKKYATCSGLPITLQIHATSAVKLDFATKFNLDSYLKHPENSDFGLKLLPSGSITFDSILKVEGHSVDAGYKVSSTLHSSMGSDFSLKTVQGSGFEIIHKLPLNTIDILSMKSGAYSIVQEKGNPIIETPLTTTDIERFTYNKNFEQLVDTTGLSFLVSYDFNWNGNYKSILPFSGPSSFSLKILKVDEKLTKYVMKATSDLKSPLLKYIKLFIVTPRTDIKRGIELFVAFDKRKHPKFVTEYRTPYTRINLQSTLVNTDKQKTIEVRYSDGSQHVFNMGVKCEDVDGETIKYSPLFETAYSNEMSTTMQRHPLVPYFDVEGSIYVKRNVDSQNIYPKKVTLKDISVITPESKHSLQGSLTFENNEVKGDASLTTNGININMNGYISQNYPKYKTGGTFNMVRNEQSAEPLLLDDVNDDYEPKHSKIIALLNKVKTLSLSMSHELNIESPYVVLTNNRLLWNDDHIDINSDILFENNELTMHGDMFASNLFDLILNGNITISPNTQDSGIFLQGFLQHGFNSDSSNTGSGNLKYAQDKDKSGGYLELNTERSIIGTFHLNTQHRLTKELFIYNLNYDNIDDGNNLKVSMNMMKNDLTFKANFDSPNNPDYKTSIVAHGWLEKENIYLISTNMLWPGSDNDNYLKANGKMILNGLYTQINGSIDFPSVNLKNVHVALQNEPILDIENGGIATVRCTSNNQILLSEKFKYKFSFINTELDLSGESIHEDSLNFIPINFEFKLKNYTDNNSNTGKEIIYLIKLLHNGQKCIYKKNIKYTKNMLIYRQQHKIDDDELNISAVMEYDIQDLVNWSYSIKSKMVTSPNTFKYFMYEDQNMLEFTSQVKLSNYAFDKAHSLKIYTPESLDESYEFKFFINYKESALKIVYGEREIRGLGQYSLITENGGLRLSYSSKLWLDYISEPESKSILSLDTYYRNSRDDGLSTTTDFQIFVPSFHNKTMGLKTDIQLFKNWETLISAKLELNIFPTSEKTLQIYTSLNRNVYENGVLYSAALLAKSDGMKLNYGIKDSILISKNKLGKYFDASFVDSNEIKRPIQLYFELVPGGFTNKINLFDISQINVESKINVNDGALNTHLIIDYNNHPYTIELTLTSHPRIKYIMGWRDKTGQQEQLNIDCRVAMNDSAVISATRIKNNQEAIPVGSISKSLTQLNWWATDNQLNSEQFNIIWRSLKSEFIGRFIDTHSILKNISVLLANERKLRFREARKAKSQIQTLVEYTRDECSQILNEMLNEVYIFDLLLNCTEAAFVGTIDLMEYIKLKDSIRSLSDKMATYSRNTYDHYLEKARLLLMNTKNGYSELVVQLELTLQDFYNMLNDYTNDDSVGEMSSEPHSLKDYLNDIIKSSIKKIKELKVIMDRMQDISVHYIKSSQIYDLFHDEIEKLKSYPYNDKLCKEIHKYLHELESTAPTKDSADFINSLDNYIQNVIRGIPVTQRDIIYLRNKGLIVGKSMLTNFSDYVDFNKAMTIYGFMSKVTDFSKTILYIASPGSFQNPSKDQRTWYDFSKYMNMYLNQLNRIPPYKAQGVIIASNNIITYNKNSFSFMPNSLKCSYILANDFKNNKFTIIGNYENNVLTSITVFSYNSDTYELHPGGSITVNGENVDLPMTRDNVKISKNVDYVTIDFSVGVSIECTYKLDIITVLVNGYYHNQVFGLLGSMYQEPSLDFILPNGKTSNNLESFVSAYKITGNTNPTINNLISTNQKPCSNLFSGISTLKEVFPIIEPTAYRKICNQIVSSATSQEDILDKACLVAKAYVRMAQQKFASNCVIPDMCITTTVYGRTLNGNSNVQISDKSDTADIMLLIEETEENQKFLSTVKPFVEGIVNNFNSKGIDDVRFIVIYYSENAANSGVQMHILNKADNYKGISNIGTEWQTPQATALDVDTNGLSSKVIQSFNKVIGTQLKDKAYKIATEYPFRGDAVKAIVSLSQTLYNKEQNNLLDLCSFKFNYMTSKFVEEGIPFYLIAPINLTIFSENDIFGASEMNTIYTMSAPNGKTSANEYTYDKSLETDMTLKTHGAMYDTRSFTHGTDNQRNTFLRSLCRTVVKNAVKDSSAVKRCTTSVYNGVMPFPRCTIIRG